MTAPAATARDDRTLVWLWVPVLAGVLYVLKHGYTYGVGDHDEMLPQLFRMLDPDLYPRDWFVVEQGARFTVRTPFLWLLRVVCAVLPPWGAVLLVYVGGLLAVGSGVFTLGRALGVSRPAAAAATVASVGVIPTWALAGSGLWFNVLVPEMLGWALVLPAMRLVVLRRPILAGLCLGAAAYLHVLVAFLATGGILLAVLLGGVSETQRQRWADAVKLGLAALVVALPMGLLILHDRATGPPIPPDGYSTWFLIVELRLPHHYLPTEFGLGAWLRFGLLTLVGALGLGWLRWQGRSLRFVERYALATALLCGAAWIAVEGVQSLFAAQLQVFKLTVPLIPLFLLAGAEAFLDVLPRRLADLGRWPFRHVGASWAVTGVVLLATGFALAYPLRERIDPVARQSSNMAQIERWARDSTQTDALFIVPPSNSSFRSGSRRSVAITYKPTSFQEGSTHLWYDRLIIVAPAADPPPALGFAFADSLDAAYARNRPSDWQRIADTFGADYALVDRQRTRTPPGRPVTTAGRWAVYRLPAPVGRTPASPF